MNRYRLFLLILPLFLVACAAKVDQGGTISQLRNKRIEIKEVEIQGGFEMAMESYQRFLEESHNSAFAPEAMRRLADLKIEKEYGRLTEGDESAVIADKKKPLPAPETEQVQAPASQEPAKVVSGKDETEGEAEFEKRATGKVPLVSTTANDDEQIAGADDLERAGALEAVALYQKLLNEFPLYERNDQVLYQMSRAYEELGRTKEAMEVMERLVHEYPNSRYIDEVQFRRAEYFFSHHHYLDAEDAYKSIVNIGVGSFYFQLALYKLGWTFYKQELYDEALDRFIALLDYKVSVGYDFGQTEDETESKRTEDTFRVISLGFSYLGGAKAMVDYFSTHGRRAYEDRVYSNLAEYYVDKRRFSDATATYNAFVNQYPFHEKAPIFDMRVIEINIAGGFPTLVIDSKKAFATNYGLKSEYWQHFEPASRPEVLGFLKTNLKDLANHYHALYQDKKRLEEKPKNFGEALHWYREYISSFPAEVETAAINYQLASLLLENRSYADAAVEYEKTAYEYPRHEKSAEAGYDAVYAYRQQLDAAPAGEKEKIRKDAVRSSLKFADTYPEHDKAAIVLGAAADDLDHMQDYGEAQAAGRKLIEKFPNADKDILRGGWLVVAHSSFEIQHYSEAETGYGKVLDLLPEGDKSRSELVDNLAISIYKQGEEAKAREDYRVAADHFLRVGVKAPTSKYRPDADYDAAAALIVLKDWKTAATVLSGFRENYPDHKLQPEVTKKIAYVYKEDGQLSLAAEEYERIERESRDDEVRREALMTAAELHGEVGDKDRALEVYRRYVEYFPHPVEANLETRNKIGEILKGQGAQDDYFAELAEIVAIEAAAASEQTPRTRYLAGTSALVLAQQSFARFTAVQLVKPFEVNLKKKKELMKTATQRFNKLFDYEIGDVTAAATYYLAEIFANFSKSLTESERPEGLSPMELEQYELAIEDQAYPFEEKAIAVHESNLELISRGIYNEWIDKSLRKLAKFVPARYDKPEEESEVVTSPDTYIFAYGQPNPPKPSQETTVTGESGQGGTPEQSVETNAVAESPQSGEPAQTQEAGEVREAGDPAQNNEPAQTTRAAIVDEQPQTQEPAQDVVAAPAEAQEQVVESGAVDESPLTGESKQNGKPDQTTQSQAVAERIQVKGPKQAVVKMNAESPGQAMEASVVAESPITGEPDQARAPEAGETAAPKQNDKPVQTTQATTGDEQPQTEEPAQTVVKTAIEANEQSVETTEAAESTKTEEAGQIQNTGAAGELLQSDELSQAPQSATGSEQAQSEASKQAADKGTGGERVDAASDELRKESAPPSLESLQLIKPGPTKEVPSVEKPKQSGEPGQAKEPESEGEQTHIDEPTQPSSAPLEGGQAETGAKDDVTIAGVPGKEAESGEPSQSMELVETKEPEKTKEMAETTGAATGTDAQDGNSGLNRNQATEGESASREGVVQPDEPSRGNESSIISEEVRKANSATAVEGAQIMPDVGEKGLSQEVSGQ